MADTETTTAPATTDPDEDVNLVTIRGTVASEPRSRDLPSGNRFWSIEVRSGDATLLPGDRILVCGSVKRRFFRAGAVTQSRTEVVADTITKGRR